MKQYITAEQTAKLIELGFERPFRNEYLHIVEEYGYLVAKERNFSIGELIDMLDGVSELEITRYGSGWEACDALRAFTSEELIDTLFDMVVKLKEEGVI